jgi:hypothetical protein
MLCIISWLLDQLLGAYVPLAWLHLFMAPPPPIGLTDARRGGKPIYEWRF